MREERKTISLNASEESAVIEGLNKVRNDRLTKGQCTALVNDLMLKIIHAPSKKARLRNEAR